MREDTALLVFHGMESNNDVLCSLFVWWGSIIHLRKWKATVSQNRDIEVEGNYQGIENTPSIYEQA